MQKILPLSNTIYIDRLGKEVEITDLSVGYITKSKLNPENDTITNLLKDATNLTNEEIENLKYHEAVALQREALRLTAQAETGEAEGDSSGKH